MCLCGGVLMCLCRGVLICTGACGGVLIVWRCAYMYVLV